MMIRLFFFLLFFISYQCKADGLKGLGVFEEVVKPFAVWLLISLLILMLASVLLRINKILIGRILYYLSLLSLTLAFIFIYTHYVFEEGYRYSTLTRFFYFGQFAKIKIVCLLIIIVLIRAIWKMVIVDLKKVKGKGSDN